MRYVAMPGALFIGAAVGLTLLAGCGNSGPGNVPEAEVEPPAESEPIVETVEETADADDETVDVDALDKQLSQASGSATKTPPPSSTIYKFTGDSSVALVGTDDDNGYSVEFEVVEGSLMKPSEEDGDLQFQLVVDTASMTGADADTIAQLKGPAGLASEVHPNIHFTSTAIAKADGENSYELTGNLDLHGIAKRVTVPAQLTLTGDNATLQTEFAVETADFDLADSALGETFVLELDLTAQREA